MRVITKKFPVILLTVFLLLLAVFAIEQEDTPPLHFRILHDVQQQDIFLYDAQDGNCYVFLPACTDLGQLEVILPPGQEVFLDDIPLTDKMLCNIFKLETPYVYKVDGKHVGNLWFYQSQNVAAMFVDTVSGEMTEIHKYQSHEEYASVSLYTPDGNMDYSDNRSSLKGRGNVTWFEDKRPYLLTLSGDSGLLGMDDAKKWVLLANAYDETNLNNKLVFDLASQVGLMWSPDSQFVDLYLNGEYNGLYLLTEKPEVHKNRLNLDSASGEFLCKIDLWERMKKLKNPFESSMGRIIEICYPKDPDSLEIDNIHYLVYLLEEAFRSETDLTCSEIMDLDSWVRCYLIDEISGNIDADLTSRYFYYSDGKIYSGPIWDYDMAFGNDLRNQEPCSFVAKNQYKAAYLISPYYDLLYKNDSFYQRMVEIYRLEFVPVLQKMMDHDINALITQISASSRMNSIRWRSMYDELTNSVEGTVSTSTELQSYFERRIRFLESAWLENKEYCTVQFELKKRSPYWSIAVEKGAFLEIDYMDIVNKVWEDAETGMVVDLQKPIIRDMILTPKSFPEETSELAAASVETAMPETTRVSEESVLEDDLFFWIGTIFTVAFFLFALIDALYRRKDPI